VYYDAPNGPNGASAVCIEREPADILFRPAKPVRGRRFGNLDAHPVVDLGHTRGFGGQFEGLIARGVVRHFAAERHFTVFRRDFEVRALQLRVGEHFCLDVGGYVLVAPTSRAAGSQPYRQNNPHE